MLIFMSAFPGFMGACLRFMTGLSRFRITVQVDINANPSDQR